jgi:hypothetical protein
MSTLIFKYLKIKDFMPLINAPGDHGFPSRDRQNMPAKS